MQLVHRLQYQSPEGYTSTVGPILAEETVRYEAIVAQVERLTGGELTHGSARRLSDRGWGLLLKQDEACAAESVRLILSTPRAYYSDAYESDALAGQMSMPLSSTAESLRLLSKGRRLQLSRSAVALLSAGERVAFLEVFSGQGLLALGAKAHGLN